jgi:hypothetical protein
VDEKVPVWDVFRRIPQISVSFMPISMKPGQIFQVNSYAISDRKKLAKILYIDWPVISDCFRNKCDVYHSLNISRFSVKNLGCFHPFLLLR